MRISCGTISKALLKFKYNVSAVFPSSTHQLLCQRKSSWFLTNSGWLLVVSLSSDVCKFTFVSNITFAKPFLPNSLLTCLCVRSTVNSFLSYLFSFLASKGKYVRCYKLCSLETSPFIQCSFLNSKGTELHTYKNVSFHGTSYMHYNCKHQEWMQSIQIGAHH